MISVKTIAAAKTRIGRYITETPILTSSILNRWLGHDIYFKAECLQKTGAFKARGACNAITWLLEAKKCPERIVTSSSGNHAQALAWAAGKFGIPAKIFMPANVSSVKAAATASYGGEVVFCNNRAEADARVTQAAKRKNTYWIPPYNHEQVIAGQGTAALEALHELGNVDAIFAPCGGGGLLSGSLIASRALSSSTLVIGAEPLRANDAAQSLRCGSIQALETFPDTLADGAATLSVAELTFEYLKQLDGFYEVSEEAIAYWCQWLNHLLKVRVEPTSAMTMDAAHRWLKRQSTAKSVLIILSGGNIDQVTAQKIWQHDHLDHPPTS